VLQQRLQKALAASGVASRRHAEELIAQGRVSVDGRVVREMGTLVDPDTQTILLDGTRVEPPALTRHYVALNKPVGYVSTVSDKHAPRKVTDLVRLPGSPRLVPAGRLDAETEGLILLSDDGDFVYRVTHPSNSVGKTYLATVSGKPDEDTLKRLTRGLLLPGESRKTAPAGARWAGRGTEPGTHLVELVLHEGRNRQVRRMLETVGHPVLRLIRTQIGPLKLGALQPGQWRPLTEAEVAALQNGNDGKTIPTKTGGTPATKRNASTSPPSSQASQERYQKDETRYRGRPRPGPEQNNRGAAPQRIQVHQDRLDRGLPPGGKRDAPDRRGGQGRGQGPGNHR